MKYRGRRSPPTVFFKTEERNFEEERKENIDMRDGAHYAFDGHGVRTDGKRSDCGQD
ncbi:hypothetical protein SDC9_180512 [bioreactor metagenome]|uniref:Uncharacterized protein n=1 Tax=bioreactor metagenome TaxID=1076179 RepID=A0A645H4S0_9ZZZZ